MHLLLRFYFTPMNSGFAALSPQLRVLPSTSLFRNIKKIL